MYTSDDCKMIIDLWNLYSDISSFLNIEYVGNLQDDLTIKVYDKLVYGSNIKLLKHDEYHPSFDNEEIHRLNNVLDDGYLIMVNQI